jgi:arylsulfatase A-like enzyme
MKSISFILFYFAALFTTAISAADKPNILLILSDDQGWGDYSFMGHEFIKTPNIDSLAREGVVFRRE